MVENTRVKKLFAAIVLSLGVTLLVYGIMLNIQERHPYLTIGLYQESTTDGRMDLRQQSSALEFTQLNRSQLRGKRQWEDMMEERFAKRRDILQQQCLSYGEKSPAKIQQAFGHFFYYVKKYDLFACLSAKGGSTTWKSHLLKMSGVKTLPSNVHSNHLRRKIAVEYNVNKKDKENIKYEDKNVTRVISVRHPFARLVSAYTDKFHGGKSSVTTFLKKRPDLRRDISKIMDVTYSAVVEVPIPFETFLKVVIREKNRGVNTMNNHWRPFSSACRPCHIPYNFVLQIETMEEDLRYLVNKTRIKEINLNLQRNISSKKKPSYESYFEGVPHYLIKEIYEIYKADFDLFGYDEPLFVKDALEENKTTNKGIVE